MCAGVDASLLVLTKVITRANAQGGTGGPDDNRRSAVESEQSKDEKERKAKKEKQIQP